MTAAVLEPCATGPADVVVRALRRTDHQLVRDVFAGLGPTSRQLRFLAPKRDLSEREVARLVDLDGQRQAAVVALDPCDGRGLGIARFVRRDPASVEADVAVAVVDSWQGVGLGTTLTRELAATATAVGIERFTALVSGDNAGVRRMLARLQPVVLSARIDSGAVEYAIDVPSLGAGAAVVPLPAPR